MFKKGFTPWNKGKHWSEEAKKKMSESHKGKPSWNKGLPAPWAKNNQFAKGQVPWNKGKKHSPETIEKMRLAKLGKIGELANNWKGGIENHQKKNERNDPAYQKWVKLVKKRDKNKCRINNKDCSGYCIVHHILSWSAYPELRYNINNGITLCQAHHPRKRAEEKRLIPFFQELVPVSNALI